MNTLTLRIVLGVIVWAVVVWARSLVTQPYQLGWFIGQTIAGVVTGAVGWWICEARISKHYTLTRKDTEDL